MHFVNKVIKVENQLERLGSLVQSVKLLTVDLIIISLFMPPTSWVQTFLCELHIRRTGP
jgi:hypothetical protein